MEPLEMYGKITKMFDRINANLRAIQCPVGVELNRENQTTIAWRNIGHWQLCFRGSQHPNAEWVPIIQAKVKDRVDVLNDIASLTKLRTLMQSAVVSEEKLISIAQARIDGLLSQWGES